MQHGSHMIELAEALDDDRARQLESHRLASLAKERAGPGNGIRRRVGHRLIAAGERLAYGRSQMVTR